MTLNAIPILPTEDLSVAKPFYVDKLGFEVVWESESDGRTGLVGLRKGTARINLDCPMDGHGRNACVSLETDDADALYAEWVKELPGIPAPKDEDWGERTFGFEDPSGNTLFVVGPLRS